LTIEKKRSISFAIALVLNCVSELQLKYIL